MSQAAGKPAEFMAEPQFDPQLEVSLASNPDMAIHAP